MPYSKTQASPFDQHARMLEQQARLLEQYGNDPLFREMMSSANRRHPSVNSLYESIDPAGAARQYRAQAARLRGHPTMSAYRPPQPQPTMGQRVVERAKQLGSAIRSPWLEDKLHKMKIGLQQSGRVARDLTVGVARTGGLGPAIDYAGSEFDRRMNQQTLRAVSRSRKLPEQVMQKLPQSTRRNMQATDALIQAQLQDNSPYGTLKETVEATRQRNRAIAAGADPVQTTLQWNRKLPILPWWANDALSTRFVTPKSIRHLVSAARRVAPTPADLSNPEFLAKYYDAYSIPVGTQGLQLNGKPIRISPRQAMQVAKLPQLQPYIDTLKQLKSQDKLGVLNGQRGAVSVGLPKPAADARFLDHLQPQTLTLMQRLFTGLPATYDPTQAANSVIIPSAGGQQFLPVIDYWNKNQQQLKDAVDTATDVINEYRQK